MSQSDIKFGNMLSQIEQLLRLYRSCKANDSSKKQLVNNKVANLIQKLQQNNQKYLLVEQRLNKLVRMTFADIKVIYNIKSMTSPSISSISNQNSNKSIKKNEGIAIKHQESKSSEIEYLLEQKQEKSKSQSVQNLSQHTGSSKSATGQKIDKLKQFFKDKSISLVKNLRFNYDLFNNIQMHQDEVLLLGVNELGNSNNELISICTLMRFNKAELINSQLQFQKQINDFQNIVRYPIGLAIKGQSIDVIRPQYVHFFKKVNSLLPMFFILKDIPNFDGILAILNQKTFFKILQTPFKMLINIDEQVSNKKNYQLDNINTILPNKQMTWKTKIILRTMNKKIQEAKQAITIDNGNSTCIKQQKLKNQAIFKFPYKLHSKFLVILKGIFDIYYISNQQVIYGRKKYIQNQYQLFKTQIKQTKAHFILSFGFVKADSIIKKQYLLLLLQSGGEGFCIITLTSIKQKKIWIIKLKNDVNAQMIESMENQISLSDIDKNQNPIITFIDNIDKANINEYQSKQKTQFIQMRKK